jgi:hypothetical protein
MMSILSILKIVAATGTVATGLLSLLKPRSVYGFTGLRTEDGRGITEIRAVLGGLFLALGIVPLILGQDMAYLMLGIGYLTVGLVRLVSMFVDKSLVKSNFISLAVEIIFGVILVIPG